MHKEIKRPTAETAERAKSEAEARHAALQKQAPQPETGGRKGPDPARYGDWENKGIASDF